MSVPGAADHSPRSQAYLRGLRDIDRICSEVGSHYGHGYLFQPPQTSTDEAGSSASVTPPQTMQVFQRRQRTSQLTPLTEGDTPGSTPGSSSAAIGDEHTAPRRRRRRDTS